MPEQSPPPAPATWATALEVLVARGLASGTFIDVGCADGYHGLAVRVAGVLPGADIVNVDANPVYEPSLRKIQGAIGGHYRICGVSDAPGTLALHTGGHPYWASAVAPDDPYWQTVNDLRGEAMSIPCTTLDALVTELGLRPPYVLKLDIQGLEARALRGASRMLADTAVIVCEALLHEFDALHALITGQGFGVFDLTNLHRTSFNTLGWLDVVYLHQRYAALAPARLWADEHNAAVLKLQDDRRRSVVAAIDGLLANLATGTPRRGPA